MSTVPDLPDQPTRALLCGLLAERNQYPQRAAEIDERVQQVFGRKVAILVLDMCGFSRLTVKYGILHFLAMIHQMEKGATPAVIGNGGQVIKQEADNLFAVFANPAHALEAALDIFRAFDAINAVVPEERHVRGSIGIGYGDTLIIEGSDLFGCEMNLASKLGEDLAKAAEILLTPAAFEVLMPGRYEFATEIYSICEMDMPGHRFLRCLYPRLPVKSA